MKVPESKKEKNEKEQNYELLEKKIKIIPKVNIKEQNNNINPFSKNNYSHKNKHKEEKVSILLEECEQKKINNPQYVTDYSACIFEYLKETEVNYLFLLFYRNLTSLNIIPYLIIKLKLMKIIEVLLLTGYMQYMINSNYYQRHFI